MNNALEILQTLGHKVRFKILKTLIDNKKHDPKSDGMCVCNLIELCGTANSTMTHHLDWLKSAGLLTSEKRGQWIYYDVNMKTVKAFKEFINKEL